MALGSPNRRGNKTYKMAKSNTPSFKPITPLSPISPSFDRRGVTSGHITAFIWMGCIFAFLLFIIVTEGGPNSTPTYANGTATHELVRIDAVGENYVLVSNAEGAEYKLRFPTLLAAVRNGEVKLGDEIRVKRK